MKVKLQVFTFCSTRDAETISIFLAAANFSLLHFLIKTIGIDSTHVEFFHQMFLLHGRNKFLN